MPFLNLIQMKLTPHYACAGRSTTRKKPLTNASLRSNALAISLTTLPLPAFFQATESGEGWRGLATARATSAPDSR